MMKFRTKILQAGKTATGIEFPTKVVEALGAGKRPPVRVTINGHTYRSTVAVMGGKYMLGISAEVREAAGVAGGDVVDVDVELDTAPREVTMPPELRKALARNPQAKKFFDQLSYSKKRLYTVPIEKAKTDETRQRHLDKAISELTKERK
jgi:bifunctional DNA-binding transcriptional regulator/antitoxin component of YhaV-PrlF toxin-antitoxin module